MNPRFGPSFKVRREFRTTKIEPRLLRQQVSILLEGLAAFRNRTRRILHAAIHAEVFVSEAGRLVSLPRPPP